MVTDEQKRESLRGFLENLGDIEDELSPWLNNNNIFSILRISKTEIRHSNFLGNLFNPSFSHQWGDNFIKGVLLEYIKRDDNPPCDLDAFDVMLGDFSDLQVYREYKHIDLLLISEKNNLVICIENKIDSDESGKQLEKYKKTIDSYYAKHNKIFIFLTPEGTHPSDEQWGILSYQEILNVITSLTEKWGDSQNTKINLLINDYIDTLRREVLMDEQLQSICRRIYSQYGDVLDLIYEHKPDEISMLKEFYLKAFESNNADSEIIFDPSNSSKTTIRFQLKALNKIFPDLPEEYKGGWGNGKSYFFEIGNRNSKKLSDIRLAFTGKGIPSERNIQLHELITHLDGITKKENWEWHTIRKKVWPLKTPTALKNFDFAHIDDEVVEQLIKEIKASIEDVIPNILEYVNTIESYLEKQRVQ